MAEKFSDYLTKLNIHCRYIHSDIETLGSADFCSIVGWDTTTDGSGGGGERTKSEICIVTRPLICPDFWSQVCIHHKLPGLRAPIPVAIMESPGLAIQGKYMTGLSENIIPSLFMYCFGLFYSYVCSVYIECFIFPSCRQK